MENDSNIQHKPSLFLYSYYSPPSIQIRVAWCQETTHKRKTQQPVWSTAGCPFYLLQVVEETDEAFFESRKRINLYCVKVVGKQVQPATFVGDFL